MENTNNHSTLEMFDFEDLFSSGSNKKNVLPEKRKEMEEINFL